MSTETPAPVWWAPAAHLTAAAPSPSAGLMARVEGAKAWLASLTPEEREAHFTAQRKAWVAAEIACRDEGTREGWGGLA